jgi:hypothetical protein
MRLHHFLYTGAGLLAGIALTLATIAAPPSTASAQQDAYLAAQKAQVMAVIYMLDQSGFHAMDVELAAGTLPAGGLGAVRKAKTATMATDWPEPLRAEAMKLVGHMTEFEEALRAEDIAKAGPLAKEVHDVEHDFSGTVYNWLGTGQAAAPEHGH